MIKAVSDPLNIDPVTSKAILTALSVGAAAVYRFVFNRPEAKKLDASSTFVPEIEQFRAIVRDELSRASVEIANILNSIKNMIADNASRHAGAQERTHTRVNEAIDSIHGHAEVEYTMSQATEMKLVALLKDVEHMKQTIEAIRSMRERQER